MPLIIIITPLLIIDISYLLLAIIDCHYIIASHYYDILIITYYCHWYIRYLLLITLLHYWHYHYFHYIDYYAAIAIDYTYYWYYWWHYAITLILIRHYWLLPLLDTPLLRLRHTDISCRHYAISLASAPWYYSYAIISHYIISLGHYDICHYYYAY